MGHTFSRILLHAIFSTKDRTNRLYRDMRDGLYGYVYGVARNLGVQVIKAGGVDDHVHLLLNVKPVHAPADLVRDLKANSSKWIHETYPRLHDFAWQRGYGIFSVSESAVPQVIAYIDRQEEHHGRVPFAEEFRRFLERHGVEFDPDHYLD